MALHIQDRLADTLTRRAAERFGMGITETIRVAMQCLLADGPSVSGQLTELKEIYGAVRNQASQAANLSDQIGRVIKNAEVAATKPGTKMPAVTSVGEIAIAEVACSFRPDSQARSVYTALHLDGDIEAAFRASGRGWENRLNLALREILERNNCSKAA